MEEESRQEIIGSLHNVYNEGYWDGFRTGSLLTLALLIAISVLIILV